MTDVPNFMVTTPATNSKPWQQSLTVKGAALAAAAAVVGAQGPALLHFIPGVSPADAQTLAAAVAEAMAGIGGIMAFIGRFRLGGLH